MKNTLLAISLLALATLAIAQQPSDIEQLRAEFDAMRNHYESRLQELETKLQRLESEKTSQTVTSEPAVPSHLVQSPSRAGAATPPLRSAEAQPFSNLTEFRSYSTASRDSLYQERVEHVLEDYIDINGYFRAGFGIDDQGGSQVGFKAPGAQAKYRLGNEAENFGEIIFGKNFYLPGRFSADATERPDDGPIARVQTRMDFYNPYQDFSTGSNTSVGLPEAWASIRNVLENQPEAKFWAGNRYYRRHDIHIDDFFFWNMSGGGGGVEDVQLGENAKAALAWIGSGKRSGISDLPQPDPENQAGFSKSNIDFRIYDVPLLFGVAEFGLIYSRVKSGLDANGIQAPDTDGFAFNMVHTTPDFLSEGGVNKLTLQIGSEAAKTFTSGFETFTDATGTYIRPDRPDSWRFRLTESFVADLSDRFSIGPLFVYEYTDYGEGFGANTWISAGVRPIFHLNQHFSLAFEGGIDFVDDDYLGVDGSLYKLTIAPEVAIGNFFNARPVIRAYATWASWSDAFEGHVGGNDYLNETNGASFGLQMETWW